MADLRGRSDERRPEAERSMLGAVVLSSLLHGLVLGLMILAPHRMRSAAPTAYTVELVDPGALGGKLLAGPIGGPAAEPQRRRAAPPAPPPPAPPPPEAAPKEPERLAQAETPPEEEDAEAIPLVTARPTPVQRATVVARPTAQPTQRPRPKPTATAVPTARPKPSATLVVAVARQNSPVPTASPKRLARADADDGGRRNVPPTPQGGTRQKPTQPGSADQNVDDQLAAAIKGLQGKTKAGPGGVGATGSERGMGGTEPALTGPAGVGGEGPGGGGELRGLEFVVYYNQMLTRIKENWAWVGERTDLRVTVRFSILPSGEIVNLRLVERSGDGGYDASVERAVKQSSPLAPPPQAYRSDFADVELAFRPADLQAVPR